MENSVRLLPKRRRDTLRFAAVTDLHYGMIPLPGAAALRQLRRDLADVVAHADRPDFILTVGDLTDVGAPDDLCTVQQVFQKQPLPVIPVFGNHDGVTESRAKSELPHCRHFTQTLGPIWRSFDAGAWHFVTLMNFDRMLSPAMVEEQQRWLESDLRQAKKRGSHVIVAAHFPPSMSQARWLARRGVKLMLTGHFHCLRGYQIGGLRVLTFPPLTWGGIDMTPRGFLDVTAKPNGGVRYRFKLLAQAFRGATKKKSSPMLWRRQLPGNCHRASPALNKQGRLFVASSEDIHGGGGWLHCLDAAKGRVLWKRAFPEALRAAPTAVGDGVLALTNPGTLMHLRAADGRTRWSQKLVQHPDRWMLNQPAVINGVVVAGHSGGGIEAFDLTGGNRRWHINADKPPFVNSVGDVWPTDTGLVVHGEHLLAVLFRGGSGVASLDSTTGTERWLYSIRYAYYMPSPLIWNDHVWIPPPQPNEDLVQIRLADGTEVCRTPAQGVPVTWAADDRRIYVVVLDHWTEGKAVLHCRDGETGALIWQHVLGNDPTHAYQYTRQNGPACHRPPVVNGDRLIVPCTDGTLRIFDAATGQKCGVIRLSGPTFASPAVQDNRCWATTWSGEIMCVPLK